jgi:DNA polymerase
VIVCLGATAAQSLLGRSFRVTKQRGEAIEGAPLAEWIVATIHPSAILRQRDDHSRHAERDAFRRDLEVVAALLDG